ncbi:Uncharacterised protein [Enterobacter hormaechei]|nr:Uncharacterised protein [Enterobacter hormaechei]SAB52333.1 Uncharacterised protein [Enterobacter hormaechei]SAD12757.1 Uncharacterised protein [Enterobacter hormaechei]SAG80166.1 Uncharacterised protein [Enterobacter hormaechei]SAH23966.1 Uncharacterised protein [Enterobacter hormaechei]
MNKALTNLNDGQKKPPHHVGEDRDGVYGKENRVYWLLRVLLLLLKSVISELRCIHATSRNWFIRC